MRSKVNFADLFVFLMILGVTFDCRALNSATNRQEKEMYEALVAYTRSSWVIADYR